MQQAIAAALEARAAEPSQMAMRRSYLGDVTLPAGARAADLGSGTGHLARDLVEVYGCAEVLGLDFSPVLVSRARELHGDLAALTFKQGDARATGLPDAHFDLVVLHTVLCHVPGPETASAEADRRIADGTFFGFMSCLSVLATKPDTGSQDRVDMT